MAFDLLTSVSDAGRDELLQEAADRGYLLVSQLAELQDGIVHGPSFVDELADEVAELGITLIDDVGEDGGESERRDGVVPLGLSNDPVRHYLNRAASHPLLDAQQEQDLAKRYQAGVAARTLLTGDGGLTTAQRTRLQLLVREAERARDRMIQSNLRLVIPSAKKYAGDDMPLIEAIQEGNLGLIKAVERFDPTKGYKFSTYAVWWIRKALQRGLAKRGRVVRIPARVWEQSAKIRKVETDVHRATGRKATDEEIADRTGLTLSRIRDIRDAMRTPTSLDLPVGEDGDISLGDLMADQAAADPSVTSAAADVRARLLRLLGDLPERERAVLELRYGLRDGESRTLAEVGQVLELSRERVRQLEQAALTTLRDPSAAAELADALSALAA